MGGVSWCALAIGWLAPFESRHASAEGLRPQLSGKMMPATAEFDTERSKFPIPHSDRPTTEAEPGYHVIRRNGSVTPFDAAKIMVTLTKAILAVEGSVAAGSRRMHDVVQELADQVVSGLMRGWMRAARPISRTCRTRSNWR